MKCTVPGINVKVFARAIHSLARIGDELYVEPLPKAVSFRTVNSSRSAFASFTFNSGFFTHYDEGALVSTTINKDDPIEESIKCKVAMKACVNVFKSLATLEKSVEKCKLTLDGEDAKLVIQLSCRHGIIKTYNLGFIECETLQAVYDKVSCPNHITSQSRLLSEVVVNFLLNQEEITLCVSPTKTIIKNYVDDEPDPSRVIHTELTLEAAEFDKFTIDDQKEITFCLKELRAILTFTDPVNLPITAHFSDPGKPIIFCVDNLPMFEANFVLATLATNVSSQATSSQISKNDLSNSLKRPLHHIQTLSVSKNSHVSSELQNDKVSSRKSEAISEFSSRILNKTNEFERTLSTNRIAQKNNNQTPALLSTLITSQKIPMQEPIATLELNSGHLEDVEECVPGKEENEVFCNHTPGTPPSKKTCHIFQRCFESTFDPSTVPGYDKVLAEDSDEEVGS